jgi:predicted PurR-regulated permease PerM
MNMLPDYWIGWSTAFFVVQIVLFFAQIALVVVLIRFIQQLLPMVKQVSEQINQLTGRVNTLANKVESIADSAKSTVDQVGGKAQGLASSLDTVALGASAALGRFAPYVAGAYTLLKLVREMQQTFPGKGKGSKTPRGSTLPATTPKDPSVSGTPESASREAGP